MTTLRAKVLFSEHSHVMKAARKEPGTLNSLFETIECEIFSVYQDRLALKRVISLVNCGPDQVELDEMLTD